MRRAVYLLPNDDEEADRLDMVHEMTLLMMGRRLFLAPLPPSPQRVIDVGTGTGIWAIAFGKKSTRPRPLRLSVVAYCHSR